MRERGWEGGSKEESEGKKKVSNLVPSPKVPSPVLQLHSTVLEPNNPVLQSHSVVLQSHSPPLTSCDRLSRLPPVLLADGIITSCVIALVSRVVRLGLLAWGC